MRYIDDPACMTSDERLRELASILADGVLRLHARTALPTDPNCNNLQKSSPPRLEVPAEIGLSVQLG